MARAIDVDRVKREIRKNKEKIVISCKQKYVPLSLIYEILNKAPTLTQPNEWVRVEERLPENYTDVLCWYEYFRYGDYNRMYQTYGIGYCINGQWGGEVSNGTKCKVLYWKPLPAPPDSRPPEGEA